tara:strand:- start:372 stop:497 length:126 start_codon:yes stop_codon:yes gene_type:complete
MNHINRTEFKNAEREIGSLTEITVFQCGQFDANPSEVSPDI